MTEAEKITQQMMAAYSTSIKTVLDVQEQAKPIIFDPPRTTTGTINETKRAQALLRSFQQRPPYTSVIGSSVTKDNALGITSVVGNRGYTRFYNFNNLLTPYQTKAFPGGFQSAKFQGLAYRLGQQLEKFPKGKVLTTEPTDLTRLSLYTRKSGGAIVRENPDSSFIKTRTLKNRGGNFQPFNRGKFGKSIPAQTVYDTAKGGLRRLATQDPPVVRPGGTINIPGQIYDRGQSTRIVTPRTTTTPGSGALSTALVTLSNGGAQQYLRDNTPQKVARRNQLASNRSRGTNVDNRPQQGANLDMKAIKREVKRAEIIVSFDKAFAKARRQGKKEFTWRGKRYHTRLK